MRKKYLSALLFGALLVTSAGTFTSCKDYDDDINNLQEQINTINTTLSELEKLVGDGGVSSVTFDEETGVLTVVDAKGTKTYTIKTDAGEVGEVKIDIDDDRNLVVDDKVIGKVGDTVTVNEDGYLCVNGTPTDIKAGKYAILDNDADGVVTITLPDANGELKTVELAKAAAASFTIYPSSTYATVGGNVYYSYYSLFTEINPIITSPESGQDADWKNSQKFEKENGIAWGVASFDVDWKGPKGAVKAGQLLIGQQNDVPVYITPLNVDLSAQSLKLVDAKGNEAPVKVTPLVNYIYGDQVSGSRAAINSGAWKLEITMDNTITADNIGKAFAQIVDQSGDFDVWSNKRYALQANGNIITDYVFVIDTDEQKCAMQGKDALVYSAENIKLDWASALNSKFEDVALNENHYLSFEQASVYDYKFEIVDADINDAEAWGITLENNVLKGTDAAAGKTIHLNVQLLGVNGKVENLKLTNSSPNTIAVTFGQIKSSVITLPASTYKVTPDEYDNSVPSATGQYATIVLDMGDLFSGLTAQEAIAVKEGKTILQTTDETFAFLRKTIVNDYGTGTEGTTIKFYKADKKTEVSFDDNAANIRNIKFAKVFYNESNIGQLWNPKATLGEHILRITLKDAAENEIRKANIPVNITVPSFFELFTKSGAWTDNTALAVVDETGNIDLKQLYNDKSNADEVKFFDLSSDFIADGKDAGVLSNTNSVVNANSVILNANAVSNHALKDLTTNLVYKIVPECPNFWVTSDNFTMDVVTKLDAGKFIYYGTDGKATDIVVRPETKNTIAAWDGKKTGLSFYKAGENNIFKDGEDPNGFELDVTNDVEYKFDDKAGDLASAEFENGALIVSGLAKGNYTTVLTITYTKASVVPTNNDVHEIFQIPLIVKGVE